MLDLSSLLFSWAAPIILGIVITSVQHIDSSNDRTSRPIPEAEKS